jgi:hypothetical protein
MSSRRRKDFDRWPKYYLAWKRAAERYWIRRGDAVMRDGKTIKEKFPTASSHFNWWMEENQPEAEDDCQMGLF